jgi:hypothetical protein
MYHLNTYYPTLVHDDYIVDPSIMNHLIQDNGKKRNKIDYDYTDKFNPYHEFIRDITSEFLIMNHFNHNKEKWYMDVIRYQLKDDTKRVKSGLAWHCENDVTSYREVITVLMYLHIDDKIIEGNLGYKDRFNNKLILEIKGGTTVIMDGNVPHKPQDPYGSGKRDLIIMSFEKE